VLSEIIKNVPVRRTSIGYIFMLVDSPSGQICSMCIDRFRAFQGYAPGVGLTAAARGNQYQNGVVQSADGSLLFS
jgi:hypothetical protein